MALPVDDVEVRDNNQNMVGLRHSALSRIWDEGLGASRLRGDAARAKAGASGVDGQDRSIWAALA